MPACVGVDLHVRTQTVCWCDTAKGEVEQRTLDHQRNDLPGFYRQWATPVSQEVLRLVRHRDRLVRRCILTLAHFCTDYNRRFACAPHDEAEAAWRPALRDLERICCFLHERIVGNDNVVQWEGCRFQLPPQPHRFSFAGVRVQLSESLEGRVTVYSGNTKLQQLGR